MAVAAQTVCSRDDRKLTIPEIKPSHIYELLQPIWIEKRETANRVRARIETIIAKNIDVDDTDLQNPPAPGGHWNLAREGRSLRLFVALGLGRKFAGCSFP
jgi:hypothetical protein